MKSGRLAGRVCQSAIRNPQSAIPILLALLCLVPLPATGQEIPRQHHAWARFAPGSWKLVRIVTENFDAKGNVTGASVTETRTTLKEAGMDGFTLLIESTVELDGKRIVSEPQRVTQQYNGALAGQTARSRLWGEEPVIINGASYPCRVHQHEIVAAGHKSVTRTHYSAEVAPYILRRETTTIDTANNTAPSRVVVEVKELNVSHPFDGQTLPAARMRVQQTHSKGKETTEALSSVRVPGGVIWHDSTLVDKEDVKLSHSKLELIGFHTVEREPGPHDTGLLQRGSAFSYQLDSCASYCRSNLSRHRALRCAN
jgi:hypothetical protein